MPKQSALPFLRRRGVVVAGAAVVVAAALGVGLELTNPFADDPAPKSAPEVELPAADAVFDYQIGRPYPPAKGVTAVSRDRSAEPARGFYNVCYVNAFQAQPDALDWWEENHPDLILRDKGRRPVIDEDWDEALLDTSTADKRARLSDVVGPWVDGCAESGFQAVELDNLDSYERSAGGLTKAHNAAFAKLLADRAHTAGLAVGQKNTTDLLPDRRKIGFDFAVAEECGQYDECGAYAEAYANRVFVIEYEDDGFRRACAGHGSELAVVQRDLDVAPRGSEEYVFRTC
ncbi:endo alpha-1,4 polygalactosaminidase [Streptomyces antibioticus]|uniref:endo alpha-1,4 polygalactosaminidase n=1 Tax=Streptomyces antibioticus TaxID=1890 RepID=UPI002252D956|nr:endo alpha-1,4 polygalactosaminidase [Streptomyces antibioticus]MCX5166714.1 endo alpha-1,4 polygalactosaminidase [Streptomyces antibioticus]